MKQVTRAKKTDIYFRRFSGKGFAAFASLGRRIKICRLSAPLCVYEDLKSGVASLFCLDGFFDRIAGEKDTDDNPPGILSLLEQKTLLINLSTSQGAPCAEDFASSYINHKFASPEGRTSLGHFLCPNFFYE